MIPYSRVNPKNEEIQRVESSLVNTFQSLVNNPLLANLVIKKAIVLTSGVDNIVEHGVGKAPNGWIIVDQNTDAIVYKSSTVNTMPNTSIILNTNKTVTVNILFF